MKEESNYYTIPGQWANELKNAAGVQDELFLTLVAVTLNVNAYESQKVCNLFP